MPFARPLLADIRTRVRQDMMARLPGADALLRQSNVRVIADAVAGESHEHYGYQVWLSLQLFIDTCESSFLDRWASVWGVLRKPPTPATGPLAVTGLAAAVVPAGYTWQRSDGVQFALLGDPVTLDGTGAATVTVQGVTAGLATNTATAATFSTMTAAPGIGSTAIVAAPGLSGGTDIETDAELRTRLLLRIQEPAHGGTVTDYEQWALAVPGVTRVWVFPQELGAGNVTVRFCMDDADHPNGIPTPADVATVQAYMNTQRPVTVELIVAAPIPVPLDVAVGELTPNTPDVQASVKTELADMLFRDGSPGGTVRISWLWEAVSLATGEQYHKIVVPTDDVAYGNQHLPVLGTVTFV